LHNEHTASSFLFAHSLRYLCSFENQKRFLRNPNVFLCKHPASFSSDTAVVRIIVGNSIGVLLSLTALLLAVTRAGGVHEAEDYGILCYGSYGVRLIGSNHVDG